MTKHGGRNPRWRGMAANGLLALFSLAAVTGGMLALDRLVGHFWPELPPEQVAILFPPDSTHAFESLEYSYTAHTNSIGLRDYPIDLNNRDSFRIAVIGDSFTYGWGVDIEDVWVKRVERSLREAGFDVKVINMGRPGAGSVSYAELAEESLSLIKPDLVVIALLHNDMAHQEISWRSRLIVIPRETVGRCFPNLVRLARQVAAREGTPQMLPGQEASAETNRLSDARAAQAALARLTTAERKRFDALEPVVREAFLDGRLNPFMVISGIQASGMFVSDLDLGDSDVRSAIMRLGQCLRRLRRAAAAVDAACMAVIIPTGPYVNDHQYRHVQRLGFFVEERMICTDAPDRIALLACEKAGIPCHSVTEAFRAHSDRTDLYFPLDGHFAPAGHRLYADLVTPIIQTAIADKAPRRTGEQS